MKVFIKISIVRIPLEIMIDNNSKNIIGANYRAITNLIFYVS